MRPAKALARPPCPTGSLGLNDAVASLLTDPAVIQPGAAVVVVAPPGMQSSGGGSLISRPV
jgi:hypothetical protein